jgi:hypothetical protein
MESSANPPVEVIRPLVPISSPLMQPVSLLSTTRFIHEVR